MPNLDSEPQLNIEIMKIYDSIKEIGHFDYGFANCNYGFSYDNLKKLNTDFVKHVDAFLKKKQYNSIKVVLTENMSQIHEDGDNNYFQQFLYDIASVLRDFDGHEFDENDDIAGKYEKKGEDYPDIHDLKKSGKDFLETVLSILPKKPVGVKFETTYSSMGISASRYFSIIYRILLKTVLDNAPANGGTRRRRRSRGGTRRRRGM